MERISGYAIKLKISRMTHEQVLLLVDTNAEQEEYSFRDRVLLISAAVGITEQTLYHYMAGKIPENFRTLPALCRAIGCHASELLVPEARRTYELILFDVEALGESGIDFMHRNLETVRLSREVLRWERFFTTGVFGEIDIDDDELQKSNEVEKAIAELLLGRKE